MNSGIKAVALVFAAVVAACNDDGSGPNPPPPPPPPGLTLVQTVAIPDNYGIHDTFVRDGLAFVLAWNTGLIILDVGNGIMGGTPADPVEMSRTPTNGGQAHNGWWFHNPTNGEKRYFFVGEEGPAGFGSSAGDIHVLDVSDLTNPVDVAFFHLDGAGPHNFWMDESAQILYAAYYEAGVVALDVSGDLEGDLSSRELTPPVQIGGSGNTFTWGVQLDNGSLYAIDMFSGLWRLTPGTLTPTTGGNNVSERYSSDMWVHGNYAYTGTWGFLNAAGNAIKVWDVAGAAPVLVDSMLLGGVGTVSDVQVSDDGRLLVASAENGSGDGLFLYDLTDPAHPQPLGTYLVNQGLHTVTLSTIGGRLYAFAARNPSGSALMIFDLTDVVP